MATLRIFEVILNPAKANNDRTITIEITKVAHREKIEAASVPELLSKVESIAKSHGKGCSAYVRIADAKRKPSGFDSATSKLFYNLEENGEAAASTAA